MTNFYLTETEYAVLSELGGDQLNKRRYPFQYDGQNYGIDAYDAHLQGLIVAEIEARSGSDITGVPVPAFAHQEITGDPVFNGAKLAGLKSPELHQILLDYQVI
jgi:CYTH domain-containing protein